MATSRSAAVKRLMKELAELRNDPSPEFTAAPLEENLLEWHFTLRGPPEGGFEGGRFHGRLIFPPEYPFKPPNISFLTPNGRFEVGKKICLSITDHHPEYWRPAWGVRTALVALISFLPTPGDGAIGALDHTPEERRAQALLSRTWVCPTCGSENANALPDETERPSEKLSGDPEISFTTREAAATEASSAQGSGSGQQPVARETAAASSTAGASPSVASPASGSAIHDSTIASTGSAEPPASGNIPPSSQLGLHHRHPFTTGPETHAGVAPPPAPALASGASDSQPVPPSAPPRAPAPAPDPRAAGVAPVPRLPPPDFHQKLRKVDLALTVVMFLIGILMVRQLGTIAGGNGGRFHEDMF
ncbi:Ubiquitin-conjugating enzyme E2 J1 [Geranomyces variabilis]|uniref:Ubiquitin-conjugating enzyme E2 J1 n=1 Tax=Geranomyces variabilis TaxID=109894 RepID=A0AAD5TPF9_9FUNG|nr:Ubiquitin-conjugating enzyme E2 J1 [Geranomyces variabilis]